jgi:hypothetical protein
MTSVATDTSSTGMSLFLFLTSVVFDVFGLTGVYTNSLQSLTLYLASIVALFFFHLLTYKELVVFFRFIILSALFVVGGNIRGSMVLDWFPSSREVQ